MKSVKIAGIRLINYLDDNINWKDHKEVVLDFWIKFVSQHNGYNPKQFKDMFYVDELPIKPQEEYEKWFEEYNFQNIDDMDWVDFVDGKLLILKQWKLVVGEMHIYSQMNELKLNPKILGNIIGQ